MMIWALVRHEGCGHIMFVASQPDSYCIRAWYLLLAHASKCLGIPRSSILFAYYRVILTSYHRDDAVLTRAE